MHRRRHPSHTSAYKDLTDVEFGTKGWIDWCNQRRLHGSIGLIPPAGSETNYDAQQLASPPDCNVAAHESPRLGPHTRRQNEWHGLRHRCAARCTRGRRWRSAWSPTHSDIITLDVTNGLIMMDVSDLVTMVFKRRRIQSALRFHLLAGLAVPIYIVLFPVYKIDLALGLYGTIIYVFYEFPFASILITDSSKSTLALASHNCKVSTPSTAEP